MGITAIELLPVHQFVVDQFLTEKGLTNYWGYNTIGFFAPDVKYANNNEPGAQVAEFKQMVKTLHNAGIEVILDVVYNHTGEGNECGPTLSFKGIDNSSYYRLSEENPFYYKDFSGTGNTLNALQPNVLKLIMDSLRYWVQEMHVDGFRFDLAAALARGLHEVDRLKEFFSILFQDPIISQAKLIAEPWDVGDGGYQVGNFPPGWGEWNGKYRDCIRDYWRGAHSMLGEFAQRFTGSADLYKNDYRNPTASINFITAHDGFTLRDLVSYNDKHNEANLDNNTDGDNENRSCNYGVEGDTDDETINAFRQKQLRNLLTTLFLSQGVPMLVAGDEMGRTQKGNNNCYCQDNELSWINWKDANMDLLEYTSKVIHFYKNHPSFSRKNWFQGRSFKGSELTDIAWFLPNGNEMAEENWKLDFAKSLAVCLNGNAMVCLDALGKRMKDDTFYIIFNAHGESLQYKLPDEKFAKEWSKVIDTYTGTIGEREHVYKANEEVCVEGFSMMVLISHN